MNSYLVISCLNGLELICLHTSIAIVSSRVSKSNAGDSSRR